MNIIDAIRDENLFRPFLADRNGDITTWQNWQTCLRALYGRPISSQRYEFIREVTGRDAEQLPDNGFDTALFLTGRRSGKSRIAAVIGAYEAALAGHESKLSPGEKGIVAVVSPTKQQSKIVKDYTRAIFEGTPLLASEVANETVLGFDLKNNNSINILTGDPRMVRGFTLLAAIVDEAAFFGLDADALVKSDTELVRALKPALATTGGKLVAISSPYARKGWCYTTHRNNFGNDFGKTLVVNCPSRTLNPTLSPSIVQEALAEDLQAAKSEYLGEFRDDVAEFLPRSVIERLVVEGRKQLSRQDKTRYVAFVDVSGGRIDDAALAIAHRQGKTVVIDALFRYKPPFDPRQVIQRMVDECRRYNVRRTLGDNYSAEFVSGAFADKGMLYKRCETPKTGLYVELLSKITSGEVELLDDPVLVNQLAALERRVRAGGKEIIDHPKGGHDDLANVIAGAVFVASKELIQVGALW